MKRRQSLGLPFVDELGWLHLGELVLSPGGELGEVGIDVDNGGLPYSLWLGESMRLGQRGRRGSPVSLVSAGKLPDRSKVLGDTLRSSVVDERKGLGTNLDIGLS